MGNSLEKALVTLELGHLTGQVSDEQIKEARELVNNNLEKGKSMPVGTITNGFKKIAEGKWRKVSEHGMTKEEHGEKFKEANKIALDKNGGEGSKKIADNHYLNYEKLDSKEYSDVDVVGEKKKDFPKKEDLVKKLISRGNNVSDSEKMVNEHYDYVKKTYPDSSISKLAEIIRTIY